MAAEAPITAAAPERIWGAPRGLWLALAVVGTTFPNAFFMVQYIQFGFNLPEILSLCVVNWIARGVTADLCTSALIFSVWAGYELRRKGELRKLWVYVLLFACLGLSCALPVFLYRHGRRD